MPKYQLPNAQTASEYFAESNRELKNGFIAYGESGPLGITLLEPTKKLALFNHVIEDIAAIEQAKPIHLTKKQIYNKPRLHTDHQPKGAYNLSVVSQDGVFDTLVWTTTPDHVYSALRSGVFPRKAFQNKITEMIALLGEYKRNVFKQSVEEHFVVKNNSRKLKIVDVTQDCLEDLSSLYCSINNFEEGFSAHGNLEKITTKVTIFLSRINHFITHSKLNADAQIKQIEQYRDRLKSRLENTTQPVTENEVRSILQSYTNPLAQTDLSLQHFIQQQLNTIVSQAMEANYQVSGFFRDSSKLQKILVKAQVIADSFSSYKVDYHNSLAPAHSLDFSKYVNKDNLVTLNLQNFGFAPWTRAELAEQVALIERIDTKQSLFSLSDTERGYFGINWYGNVLVGAVWVMNFTKDVLGTILDVGYIVGKGVYDSVGYFTGKKLQPIQFPSGYNWMLKTNYAESKYINLPVTAPLYDTKDPILLPHYSILEGLYVGVAGILSSLVIEPLVSVSNIVADEVWRLKTGREVMYDGSIGAKPADELAVTLLVNQRYNEMNVNANSNRVTRDALIASYNKIPDVVPLVPYKDQAAPFASRKSELPQSVDFPYHLTPDNPSDVVNWLIDDFMRGLVEVFSHNSLRDHPVAGLALTIAASTAAPMIFPALLRYPVLGAVNHHVSVPMAKYLIGDTTGLLAGVSTGILQGQICFLAAEIFNGRNSIAVDGLKTVLENPVIATIVTLAAVGFGYALAYEMNIPYLSELIVSETDQATFPWFELGIAGAKIAAILIEGTFNLHAEHHQHSHRLLEDGINKLRPEIKAAMQKICCEETTLAPEDLTPQMATQIHALTDTYCNNINSALSKPHIAEQLNLLSATINGLVLNTKAYTPATHEHRSLDLAAQDKLMQFLERRKLRRKIAMLNPRVLNTRDKYIILNYVTQAYPNDPRYIAAVRQHLENEKQAGPLGETFKIIFNYPGAIFRSITASVRSLGFRSANYYYQLLAKPDKAHAMDVIAKITWQPVRDLERKIRNDTGLLIKGIASTFRITWDLIGAIAMVPVTLIFSLPAMFFFKDAPLKVFTRFNQFAFAPGRLSQFINSIVGLLREDATAKNLALATNDLEVRYGKNILTPAAANLVAIAPEAMVTPLGEHALKNKVMEIVGAELFKYDSLRYFANLKLGSLRELLANLIHKIEENEPAVKLHLKIARKEPQFNRELKAASLAIINQIKQLPNVECQHKLLYEEKFVRLFHVNRRIPIVEIVKAYQDFMRLPLSEVSTSPELNAFAAELSQAQKALIELSKTTISDNNSEGLVISCLKAHPCLSLQSINKIESLKKLAKQNNEASNLAKKFEKVHNSASTAANRLAAYPAIVNELTGLIAPINYPSANKSKVSSRLRIGSASSTVTRETSEHKVNAPKQVRFAAP